MYQRVNVTLPEETLALIDRVTTKGDRSRFIDEAVRHFIRQYGRQKLRALLKKGYENRARRSLEIAAEWFPLEEEVWQMRQK